MQHAMQTQSSDEKAVRPFVCLSVRLSNANIASPDLLAGFYWPLRIGRGKRKEKEGRGKGMKEREVTGEHPPK